MRVAERIAGVRVIDGVEHAVIDYVSFQRYSSNRTNWWVVYLGVCAGRIDRVKRYRTRSEAMDFFNTRRG